MREIKFRGKSGNEWIYGMLLKTNPENYGEHGDKHYDCEIQTEEEECGQYNKYYITNNNTIGQYTGLKDKNGVEIYEDDILEIDDEGRELFGTTDSLFNKYHVVISKEGCFMGKLAKHFKYFKESGTTEYGRLVYLWIINRYATVAGNIYDNPELLEKEE